uniref:Midkine n=1 Tax=Scophthalmus maximus TaxID=52904 RepID=A0A8D3C9K8_SCOMX
MRRVLSVTLLLTEVDISSVAGGKHEKLRPASDCSAADTRYGKCEPELGDCGEGLRDATCNDQTDKIPCKIPCNWKKDIIDCKYKFGPWGTCDAATNTKSRSGSLKRALFNAECQSSVTVSKPCSPKPKKSRESPHFKMTTKRLLFTKRKQY